MSEYPTQEEIYKIINYKGDWHEFMNLVKSIYNETYGLFVKEDRHYRLATGGWPGNEDIIDAMENNKHFFWTICWMSSNRGGGYTFEIPEKK